MSPSRRQFLQTSVAAASARAAGPNPEPAPTAVPVPAPRATSGDRADPKWEERLTVTVGPKKADLMGADDRVIQAAVDYVTRLGGGTVRLLGGTYRLRNAVRLASGLRLVGAGEDTVLIKEPSVTVRLAEDSDWYDQEVTVTDAAGLRVGDGVCLRARNPHTRATVVIKRTLVARSGNRFRLDRALRQNLWQLEEATLSTLFPILGGEEVTEVEIENLLLDGNRTRNDNLDGNYAGCIFLQDCARVSIRGVTACRYNGDGISWQICHDVLVEGCRSLDHTGLGLHPGSGSQRSVIRNNRLAGNDLGLFFCWGVRGGLAEKNRIEDNRSVGISIGHRDTDNLIRDNDVLRSGKVGVLFRAEQGKSFAPHRNRLQGNRITDSGGPGAAAIEVQGEVGSLVLEGNALRETRGGERIGIRIGPKVGPLTIRDNTFVGFGKEVVDQRPRP
jgi:hypothetical protein